MKKVHTYIGAILLALTIVGTTAVAYAEPSEGMTQIVTTSQPQVRVLHGSVEITIPGDEDRNVTIYALTGQVVKSFTAVPGANTVELPKGYYIVKCDRVSCRVVVK